MSDKNNDEHKRQEQQRQQHEQERQRREQGGQGDQRSPEDKLRDQSAEPGSRLANPAEPYAQTVVPERAEASVFLQDAPQTAPGYPKLKYHPVHGGVVVKDPGEEAGLQPPRDWFDSPELADLARTWTEAEIVRVNNQMAKLHEMQEKNFPLVRNSVQADEAIRRAQTEPL